MLLALVGFLPVAAVAHEKWFIDSSRYPLASDSFVGSGALWWVLTTVAVFGALAVLWQMRGHRDLLPPPERFGATQAGRHVVYALLPLIIGIHVAVALIYDGTNRLLLSPNIHLQGAPAYLCGIVEIWVGLSFFYGGLTRLAAVGLALLWFGGLFIAGIQPMLENAVYLGIAAFFFLAGRGPIAIDRFMFPALEPSESLARHAVTALRVGLGASFVFVAFTEKLANLPLALAFLQRNPLNFTSYVGVPLSDHTFVLAAGCVELLVGLCLLFGVFSREIILVAWLPINLTLTYFNATELVGHLPIYGIMALLLIWIPGEENRKQWLAAMRYRWLQS